MPPTMLDIQPLIAAYRMPPIGVGCVVRYYRHGIQTPQYCTAGIVMKVGASANQVYVLGDTTKIDVKHVSDPRVQLNADHRESGTWDFTEEHYQMQEIIESLLAIACPTEEDRKSPEKSDAAKDLWALRKKCQELGSQNWMKLKRTDCERIIAEAAAAATSDI